VGLIKTSTASLMRRSADHDDIGRVRPRRHGRPQFGGEPSALGDVRDAEADAEGPGQVRGQAPSQLSSTAESHRTREYYPLTTLATHRQQ